MKDDFYKWFDSMFGYDPETILRMLYGWRTRKYFEKKIGKKVSEQRLRCLELWLNWDITEEQFIEEITDND